MPSDLEDKKFKTNIFHTNHLTFHFREDMDLLTHRKWEQGDLVEVIWEVDLWEVGRWGWGAVSKWILIWLVVRFLNNNIWIKWINMVCKVKWCTQCLILNLGNFNKVFIVLVDMVNLDLREWVCTLWWCLEWPECSNQASILQVLLIFNF